MKKSFKTFLTVTLCMILLVVAVLVGVHGFWLPYKEADSGFGPDKDIQLYQHKDGSVELHWPKGYGAEQYLLEIFDPHTQEVYYSNYITDQTSCILSELPDQLCTIRIRTVGEYKFLFDRSPRFRATKDAILITDRFVSPAIFQIDHAPDPEKDQLIFDLTFHDGTVVELFDLSGDDPSAPVATYTEKQIILSFGEDSNWQLPNHNETYVFTCNSYRQGDGYVFYGYQTAPVTLSRDDLLDSELALLATANDDASFTLSWNESKGDYYTLQYRENSNQQWQTVLRVNADGTRSYTSDTMKPYTNAEYQVQSWYDNEPEPATKGSTISVQTGAAIIYATIWPIQDLTVYTDTSRTQSLGTAVKGTAFCVLASENSMFRIRFNNDYGYIDSNYCMINLPDCIGDLCHYDIANSYSSVFKIHEYEIPGITGTLLEGYEHMQLSDGSYLVPLLYPVVDKLAQAALLAKEQGYTLKIYESFRPQKTTNFLFQEAGEFTGTQIPPEEGQDEQENTMTYAAFMTDNGRYSLDFFLAKNRSRHNQGIALDLTLEANGEEIPMQTAIHDLSWYSELAQNNSAASTLTWIMSQAGFKGLSSEWWHFQDDDALNALKPEALWEGVSPEGWVADSTGWRYRNADGSYLKNCFKTIDNIPYAFDILGYAIEDNGVN